MYVLKIKKHSWFRQSSGATSKSQWLGFTKSMVKI